MQSPLTNDSAANPPRCALLRLDRRVANPDLVEALRALLAYLRQRLFALSHPLTAISPPPQNVITFYHNVYLFTGGVSQILARANHPWPSRLKCPKIRPSRGSVPTYSTSHLKNVTHIISHPTSGFKSISPEITTNRLSTKRTRHGQATDNTRTGYGLSSGISRTQNGRQTDTLRTGHGQYTGD